MELLNGALIVFMMAGISSLSSLIGLNIVTGKPSLYVLSLLPKRVQNNSLVHKMIKKRVLKNYISFSELSSRQKLDLLNEDICRQLSLTAINTIVSSFKDDNSKYIALNDRGLFEYMLSKRDYEYDVKKTLFSIKNDKYKTELINKIKDEKFKVECFTLLEDDCTKINILNSLDSLKLKSILISSFKDEDLKIKYMKEFNPIMYNEVMDYIKNHKSSTNSYYSMENQVYSYYKFMKKICDSFILHNNKMIYLNVMSSHSKIMALKELDDEEKIKYINLPGYDTYKADLVATLKNKDDIKRFFASDNNPIFRTELIEMLDDDRLIEDLVKLINKNNKIQNLEITTAALNKVSNSSVKLKLINRIDDESIKTILESNVVKEKHHILKDVFPNLLETPINKKITIGVELEATHEYHSVYKSLGKILLNWKIKNDVTVSNGVEITSPKLHYNNKDLKELKYVCDFMDNNGFKINEQCGGHIHIGFNYFERADELKMLYTLFGNCESIFFEICNKRDSKIRKEAVRFAKPISLDLSKAINENCFAKTDDLKKLIKKLRLVQQNRYSSINIENAFNINKNTIEFRLPNGEINYDEVLANIVLFATLVDRSKALAHRLNSDDQYNIGIIKSSVSEEEKLSALLDLLFDNEMIKKIYIDRYRDNIKENDYSKVLEKTGIINFE